MRNGRLEPHHRANWLRVPVAVQVSLFALGFGVAIAIGLAHPPAALRPHAPSAKPIAVQPSFPLPLPAQPTRSEPGPTPLPDWTVTRYPMGGQVMAMALDPSAVFVLYAPTSSNPHDQSGITLARLDRSTGQVKRLGPFPGGFQLLRTEAGLWVLGGMNVGPVGDRYWLDLVDPASLVVRRRLWVPGQAGPDVFTLPQLTAAPNLLWLGYGRQAFRLDPVTGAVLQASSFDGTLTGISLEAAGRYLYVGVDTPTSNALVLQLPPNSGPTIATSETGGGGLGGPRVQAAADGVWISFATGMMGAVEHRSLDGLAMLPTPIQYGHTNSVSLVVTTPGVWVIDAGANRVTCVNPSTGAGLSAAVDSPGSLVADEHGVFVASAEEIDLLRPDPACLKQ